MIELYLGMGVVALVLVVSALVSGVVERAPLSFPMIFLGIGFALGDAGLGVISIDAHAPILEMVGVITLALVLFLDAVRLDLNELRREWYLPMLTLGPGTLLTIAGVAAAASLLLEVTPMEALLLGAILASTDAVVLRDVLRDPRIPRSVRRALGVEAGLNDIVVLPVVLVLITLLTKEAGTAASWAAFFAQILLLSPIIGLVIGGAGSLLINRIDKHFPVRMEFQALYGIGLVLAAFAAAQVSGGSGFLAAFFAGLAVPLFNTALCDCFMEFGEISSEMMMLLSFILFGVVLSTLLGTVPLLPGLALAAITLGVVRPVAFGLILQRAHMSNLARGYIGWFGPRGLGSLLLALLVVQSGYDSADRLLAITGLVVVVSVVLHGVSATPVSAWYARRVAAETLEEERESTFASLFEDFDAAEDPIQRVTPAELDALMTSESPPILLDVRSRHHYETDAGSIPGGVRVLPDQIQDWAAQAPKDRLVIAYCTCAEEATSGRVAHELTLLGFQAGVLVGGYSAWEAALPVVPRVA